MSSPYFRPGDGAGAPDPVTPAAAASSPADFAAVTPHGRGPAGYDIQAPMPDLAGAYAAAGAITGAGIVYPQGPRQAMTETLMQSPQGFALDGYDIDAGDHAGPGQDGWPANVEPAEAAARTPDRGHGGVAPAGAARPRGDTRRCPGVDP